MAYLSWFVRIVIFALLLGFAVKNLEPVTLSYFLGYQWHQPLVVFLFIFLLIGIAVGLLAAAGRLFRQQRQIQALKRELRLLERRSEVSEAQAAPTSAVADHSGA